MRGISLTDVRAVIGYRYALVDAHSTGSNRMNEMNSLKMPDVTPRIAYAPRSESATVNGVRLHYLVFEAHPRNADDAVSKRPPVVMLHGWPETSHTWHQVAPLFAAQGLTVITPDLRGLGDSARPETGYDVGTVAEDIHQLVATLGFKQVDLIGHDVGAWIAYAYAAAHPTEVRRLVVAEAGLPGLSAESGSLLSAAVNVKTWHFPFNTLPDLPEALITGREEIYMRWLFENKAHFPGAVSTDDLAIYTRAYQQSGAMSAGFAYYRAIFESVRQNRESAKTKLAMPVLALGGESGVGAGMFKTMQAVALNVRGNVLPGCGHYIPDEKPHEFASQVLTFLDDVTALTPLPIAASPDGIPTARGVDHIGLTVPDLDAAVTFFGDVLGAKVLWHIGPVGGQGDYMADRYGVSANLRVRLAMLRCGSMNVELLQYLTRDGTSPSVEEPANSDLSVGHLAFLVDDLAAATDYLETRGVRFFAGPNRDAAGPKTGETHRYFLTPWGSSLELLARPEHLPYEQQTTSRLFVPMPA
jgi:pimeloyl-ACP methyl ester carboxylesterase/catechol 2,3-dioxygenase-like lactoylglutathione lyase family enzyme